MTESTSVVAVVNPNTTPAVPAPEVQVPTGPTPAAPVSPEALAKLATLPLYATASPEVQALVRQDMALSCGEGLSEDEYLEGVATWPGTAEELLAESGPVVMDPAAPAADPAAVAEAAAAKAAAEAAVVEELVQEAEATRQKGIAAFRKGAADYRAGMLESGRLFGEFIVARLRLGAARKAAIQAVESGLAPYSLSTVDVGRLVQTYHAYRLLAEETGLATRPSKKHPAPAEAVVYDVYRAYWCTLVERVQKDTPQESYVLLPGLETECKAAFAKAVQDGLDPTAVKGLTSKLVADYAKLQAVRNAAEAEATKAARIAEAEKLNAEAAKLRSAELVKQAAEAAQKATDDESTRQALADSTAALLAQQKAVLEAQAAKEKADAEAKAAQRKAKADEERVAKAAETAAKAAEAAEKKASLAKDQPAPAAAPESTKTNPADQRGNVTGNLLVAAEKATPQNLAELLADAIIRNPESDDVLERLLGLLGQNGTMGNKARRACQAAVVIMTRTDKPVSPVEAAKALLGNTADTDKAVAEVAGVAK